MENENTNMGLKRNLPRDLFLHLLAIVTLYWSAISFTTLLWQFINYFFPDALYYYDSSASLIRFSVSSLVIVFPIFIIVSWYLNKIYRRESAVRESKIRKWLIYLTLFIASLVIIGDLVAVINNLLSGGTTIQFILKALSVLFVAVIIFGYYLDDVRRETPAKSAKVFAWISGIIIFGVIISAFFIIGTPNSVRLSQFDQQKVSDLQNIQMQIVNYWQKKQVLPASLSDLNDSISGFVIPTDPQTKLNYEFTVKDITKLSFELCANFNSPSNAQDIKNTTFPVAGVPASYNQNWNHATGRTCFERTIDKQLYPPLTK